MASPVWRANLTFGAPVSGRDVATQIGHLTTIVVVIVEVVGPPVDGGVEISTLTTQERWLVAAIVSPTSSSWAGRRSTLSSRALVWRWPGVWQPAWRG